MRRSLETEEIAPLLNAPPAVTQDVQQRELHTVENLPARRTLTLAEQQAAQQALAVTPEAQALALRREQIRKRGRTIETALNGDGGPYQQFGDIFETFAIALASGMTEGEALRRAAGNAPETMQALFTDVAAQIERGVPLVQALRKHEEQLPDLVVPIFEHGLIYGTAENASRQIGRSLKHLARVEEKFEYSALNPGMVIPLVVGGILILSLFPVFMLFTNPLVPYLLICGMALSASVLSWKYRYRLIQWKSRRRLMSQAALYGMKGFVHRQRGAARWSRTFAALWHCGVPISAALEAAGRSTNNAYYERILREAAQSTRNGKSLSDSLVDVGLLRGEMLETIRTGEMTGELGPGLEKWADVLEDDAKQSGGKILFLKTVGLLFLIALVGCIVCLALSWVLFGLITQALHKDFG
jgi:type IV pilus assembly protein PilC